MRVVAAGVCGTDIHVQHCGIPFPLPGVVGHEGAGIVEQVGASVTSVTPGDKVLMTFTSCGACRNCLTAHPAYCEQFLSLNLLGGRRSDGSATIRRGEEDLNAHFFAQSSFATYVLADERGVTRVPRDSDLEVLAPLGCGIQTGAGAVFNVLRPTPGTTLVIFGAGAVGLAAVMAAALSPVANIIVADLVDARLNLARELGATRVIDSAEEDVTDVVRQVTEGRGADYAIDATGVARVIEVAVSVLTPLGTVVSIGAPAPGTTVSVDVNYLLNGRRYVGITENNRLERQTGYMAPITPADVEFALDADAFVCVPITDYEVSQSTLGHIRAASSGVILLDGHGPTTSISHGGERVRRLWVDMDAWLPRISMGQTC